MQTSIVYEDDVPNEGSPNNERKILAIQQLPSIDLSGMIHRSNEHKITYQNL